MYIWEPQMMKCPDCGTVFYWPCAPDEFYRCGDNNQLPQKLREAHPEVGDQPYVGDDDHAPPDVDRGGFKR